MTDIINIAKRRKLIYLPAIIILAAITLAGFISYSISKQILLSQLEQDGFNYVSLLSKKIESHVEQMNVIQEMLEERSFIAANMTLGHESELNNEILADIAEKVGIDEIFWYNNYGEILYSATGEYIGWHSTPGDPIDQFMESGKAKYVEGIRQSVETDEYFLFVYIRNDEDYFVQAGIRAEEVYRLTQKHSFQNIVEESA